MIDTIVVSKEQYPSNNGVDLMSQHYMILSSSTTPANESLYYHF